MTLQEAQRFAGHQRFPQFTTQGMSDSEILRDRERLFNGLAMFFGFTIPVAYGLGCLLRLQVYGCLLGTGLWIYLCRRCSDHGNRCRNVRMFLESQKGLSA